MKDHIVITSNVSKFISALGTLQRHDGKGEERMGLLWGNPGEGKSTTISYVANQCDGIYLRARVTWTVTSMLRALMNGLELGDSRYRDRMISDAIRALKARPRPIFVDEADYLFRHTDMLDALRDVYDEAGVPLILIGMEDIARRIRSDERLSRFRRRITQWVQFTGLKPEDTHLIADDLFGVAVADDLLARVHQETKANIGNVIIALSKIEQFGLNNASTLAKAETPAGRRPLVTLKDFRDRALL